MIVGDGRAKWAMGESTLTGVKMPMEEGRVSRTLDNLARTFTAYTETARGTKMYEIIVRRYDVSSVELRHGSR